MDVKRGVHLQAGSRRSTSNQLLHRQQDHIGSKAANEEVVRDQMDKDRDPAWMPTPIYSRPFENSTTKLEQLPNRMRSGNRG
jgi:hypothetical protein